MKRYSFLICLFVLITSITCYANASRNEIISTINNSYYTDDMAHVVEAIGNIDASLKDEEYITAVFDCLDDYSVYYDKEYVENQTLYNITEMIEYTQGKDLEIKIYYFGNGVEDCFANQMNQAKKSKVKRLILDLTECPGGYINVMKAIANEIVPKGKIMTAKFKNNEQVYYSELEKCPFDEIIVKVSSQTASAAEILAASLQEAGVATVVGVNTYGKTSIQSFHRLENGCAFKLTCGEYLTRNGNDISKSGVIPDKVDYSYPIKIRWNDYCKEVLRNNKAVSK